MWPDPGPQCSERAARSEPAEADGSEAGSDIWLLPSNLMTMSSSEQPYSFPAYSLTCYERLKQKNRQILENTVNPGITDTQ